MSDEEPKKESNQAPEETVAPKEGAKEEQQTTSNPPVPVQTYNIFVGDLPHNITESQMRDHFSKFGDIKLVNIIRDKVTGLCKGASSSFYTLVGALCCDLCHQFY